MAKSIYLVDFASLQFTSSAKISVTREVAGSPLESTTKY
jgi:hypothetical protein